MASRHTVIDDEVTIKKKGDAKQEAVEEKVKVEAKPEVGEGKVKVVGADDTTLPDGTPQKFLFRSSTPTVTEGKRTQEPKKFNLRPEKYDGKVDFEGWIDQFEGYATLGHWTEQEKTTMLFLSLTATARQYFVGLPHHEKLSFQDRVEALRRRFGHENDTSNALQELAALRRGKGQTAKELADNARRLACRAYYSNDYASKEKAALHAFQAAVGEELQLKCAEKGCSTLEEAVEVVEVQERYARKAVRAAKQEEALDVNAKILDINKRMDQILTELNEEREQRKQATLRRDAARKRKEDCECHNCHRKGHYARECPDRKSGNAPTPSPQ